MQSRGCERSRACPLLAHGTLRSPGGGRGGRDSGARSHGRSSPAARCPCEATPGCPAPGPACTLPALIGLRERRISVLRGLWHRSGDEQRQNSPRDAPRAASLPAPADAAAARGAAGEADACGLMTAPGASVSPPGSASLLSPGSKLVRKAIIVLNKMHLLRGEKIRITSLFERGYNL